MRRVGHRRGADDEEVDVAAAVEDGGAGGGAELVFRHAGLGARDHRFHRALAQHAGLAHAAKLLLAVDHDQLVQEALGEDELSVRQRVAQHVVLVDGKVVVMPRVDLDQADASTLELELLEPLDHDLGIFSAAAVPHVGQGVGAFAPAGFGVGAAHGEHQGRLAVERHQHIGGDRMPFPVAGEPLHAAAEAPVARSAGHDHAVELVLAHLVAQRLVAALRIPAWRNDHRPRRDSTACRTCSRTAHSGRGACAPRPSSGVRRDAASGCSWRCPRSCACFSRKAGSRPGSRPGRPCSGTCVNPCNCRC